MTRQPLESVRIGDIALPFRHLRNALYTPAELFKGLKVESAATFAQTLDFRTFVHFVVNGGATSGDSFVTTMQSLHDNSISLAVREFLTSQRCVAVMGGHKLRRDSEAYGQVASLARLLAQAGFTIASGGGPGAMEATHLGARFSTADDATFATSLAFMAKAPALPEGLIGIVDRNGVVDRSLAEAAHTWFVPAWEAASHPAATGQSLSVPTWHYGHEPSTPLATHIAKYFQSSIREDGLLAIAGAGVVYAEGRAGTVQEVFQDAAQNYYRSFGRFSPMVFLGERYWTQTLPVRAVLASLFSREDFARYVLFTDDVNEAYGFLASQSPEPRSLAYPEFRAADA